MLENVNEKVRKSYNDFKDKVSEDKLDPILKKASGGLTYYNTSKHTLYSLKDEPQYIEINFNNYLNGFNPEVANGVDRQTYPVPAVYTVGVNVKI